MNLDNIDWIIVGGESGRKPRPMNVDWGSISSSNAKQQA
jgi:protein gp37